MWILAVFLGLMQLSQGAAVPPCGQKPPASSEPAATAPILIQRAGAEVSVEDSGELDDSK
jgi:hypothetical protein